MRQIVLQEEKKCKLYITVCNLLSAQCKGKSYVADILILRDLYCETCLINLTSVGPLWGICRPILVYVCYFKGCMISQGTFCSKDELFRHCEGLVMQFFNTQIWLIENICEKLFRYAGFRTLRCGRMKLHVYVIVTFSVCKKSHEALLQLVHCLLMPLIQPYIFFFKLILSHKMLLEIQLHTPSIFPPYQFSANI